MSITTTDVWQKYHAALAALVAGSGFDKNTQAISFAGSTLIIDIANADPLISNENIFNVGNVLPAWNACYTPQGGLLSTYAMFLDNINLGGDIDPNIKSQMNKAMIAYNDAQANFTGANGMQSKAIAAWKAYKDIDSSVDFPTYVQSQFPLYITAKADLQAKEIAVQNLLIKANGAGYSVIADARNKCSSVAGAAAIDMQNRYNMAIETGSTTPDGSGPAVLPGENPSAPVSSLIKSFAPAYGLDGFTEIFQEWQTNSVAGVQNAGPITVTGDSGTGGWDNYGWAASGSGEAIFEEFFAVSASGSASSNTQTVNTQSSSFSLSVKFTGLQAISIHPGQWYDGGIVETFKDKLLAGAPKFFGEGGSMGLLPTRLIIGFEPTITLKLENSDYSSFKNQYQAQTTASIDIGPFKIGSASVSTYSDKTDIKYDDASSTITIGPVKSSLPLLLGVISTKLQSAAPSLKSEAAALTA
jgi:hypothetical protein